MDDARRLKIKEYLNHIDDLDYRINLCNEYLQSHDDPEFRFCLVSSMLERAETTGQDRFQILDACSKQIGWIANDKLQKKAAIYLENQTLKFADEESDLNTKLDYYARIPRNPVAAQWRVFLNVMQDNTKEAVACLQYLDTDQAELNSCTYLFAMEEYFKVSEQKTVVDKSFYADPRKSLLLSGMIESVSSIPRSFQINLLKSTRQVMLDKKKLSNEEDACLMTINLVINGLLRHSSRNLSCLVDDKPILADVVKRKSSLEESLNYALESNISDYESAFQLARLSFVENNWPETIQRYENILNAVVRDTEKKVSIVREQFVARGDGAALLWSYLKTGTHPQNLKFSKCSPQDGDTDYRLCEMINTFMELQGIIPIPSVDITIKTDVSRKASRRVEYFGFDPLKLKVPETISLQEEIKGLEGPV
jgi:hypothetical protein